MEADEAVLPTGSSALAACSAAAGAAWVAASGAGVGVAGSSTAGSRGPTASPLRDMVVTGKESKELVRIPSLIV